MPTSPFTKVDTSNSMNANLLPKKEFRKVKKEKVALKMDEEFYESIKKRENRINEVFHEQYDHNKF